MIKMHAVEAAPQVDVFPPLEQLVIKLVVIHAEIGRQVRNPMHPALRLVVAPFPYLFAHNFRRLFQVFLLYFLFVLVHENPPCLLS